jgi:GcrA cell cycle regulator
MEWSEETIVRLRELWSEGHSTAEIGRRLGVSKNAIVGKAHRLDLEARPSPIRRGGSGTPAPRRSTPRRVAGPTLPPLDSTAIVQLAPPASAPIVVAPKPAAPPAPRVIAVAPPAPRPYGRVITCCWPIGEPGTRSFRFCDVESVPGKPYCTDHAQVAYVKIRDKREDAA